MKMQDIKTLITSGTIILAVALYMIFGRSPADEKDATSTDQNGIISIEQVEEKKPEINVLQSTLLKHTMAIQFRRQ